MKMDGRGSLEYSAWLAPTLYKLWYTTLHAKFGIPLYMTNEPQRNSTHSESVPSYKFL